MNQAPRAYRLPRGTVLARERITKHLEEHGAITIEVVAEMGVARPEGVLRRMHLDGLLDVSHEPTIGTSRTRSVYRLRATTTKEPSE